MQPLVYTRNTLYSSLQSNDHDVKLLTKAMSNGNSIKVVVEHNPWVVSSTLIAFEGLLSPSLTFYHWLFNCKYSYLQYLNPNILTWVQGYTLRLNIVLLIVCGVWSVHNKAIDHNMFVSYGPSSQPSNGIRYLLTSKTLKWNASFIAYRFPPKQENDMNGC